MLFGGDQLYMFPPVTSVQCMGFLLAGAGDVIGIDCGTAHEAEEVERVALSLGGKVDCWFLTHAHFDHIEGLTEILRRGKLKIGGVCYAFPPIDYIARVERNEGRRECVTDLERAIGQSGVPRIRPQKGKRISVGHFSVLPLSDGSAVGETLNPSSVVYRVETRGDSVLFLGDMDFRAEEKILREFPEELRCPVVQMAHHGQNGVSEAFYRHIRPKVCLWPTPDWLWNNDAGGGYGTGPFATLETRAWMEKLGTVNYRAGKEITVVG